MMPEVRRLGHTVLRVIALLALTCTGRLDGQIWHPVGRAWGAGKQVARAVIRLW
jgi:hypothetical protein